MYYTDKFRAFIYHLYAFPRYEGVKSILVSYTVGVFTHE
jgi:hypothetical protein